MKDYLQNKFPDAPKSVELLSKYFDKLGINNASEITAQTLDEIFVLMMDDYMEFIIDLDQLAILCGQIHHLVIDNANLAHSPRALFLLNIAELDWALRKSPESVSTELQKIIETYKELKEKK